MLLKISDKSEVETYKFRCRRSRRRRRRHRRRS